MIFDIVKESINYSWPTLIIISVTLILVRIFYHRYHRDHFTFYKEFWTLFSIIYLILLYDLVTNVELNVSSGVNIVPFTEILRYDVGSKMFYFNVLGNILLFLPFGYIISSYINPKKIWPSLIIGLLVSTTIEFVQLNIGRSFDIDDIILNTIGCIIGYLLYIAIKAILNHLPRFFQSDWFNNLICLVLSGVIILYILKISGVVLGI